MAANPLQYSPAFSQTVQGLHRLHQLTVKGMLDSPEADEVRDEMDAPWYALTDNEKSRITGLSEDLYSITDPPRTSVKQPNSQYGSKMAEAAAARKDGEWDKALLLLRRWREYVEPSLLSYLRGAVWLEAGDPATAALFYEHASALAPTNANYLAVFLSTLQKTNPAEAARRAEVILDSQAELAPQAAVSAVNALFDRAKELPEHEAEQFFVRLTAVLATAKSKIGPVDKPGVNKSMYSMICALLGFSHEFLGQNDTAIESYNDGLVASPNNEALLVARGIHRYGDDPGAIDDFLNAIRLGTSLIWPYIFLGHNYVTSGQFENCRKMCEQGLTKAGSNSVKSELAEWLAISQSELGYPINVVRASFDSAIEYDPSNERARRNLAAFESATQPIPASVYETPSSSDIRTATLADRRLRRAA